MDKSVADDPFGGLPEIFRMAADSPGYKFGSPFWKGGHLYATDRTVCVRTAMPVLPGGHPEAWTTHRGNPEGIESIFTDDSEYGDPVPIPSGLPAWPVPCYECEGRGTVECGTCDGTKKHTCSDCGQKHKCGACNATGVRECEECGGDGSLRRGWSSEFPSVQIAGHLFDPVILSRLVAGGVTHLMPGAQPNHMSKFAVTVDGIEIEGRVMPLAIQGKNR